MTASCYKFISSYGSTKMGSSAVTERLRDDRSVSLKILLNLKVVQWRALEV